MPTDTTVLPTAAPEAHGLRPTDVRRLIDELEAGGLDPHALLIARHGHVLFRGAWEPWSSDAPALVYSVSKTFTAIAIGFLVADGLIDVDAPVDRYLDEPNPHGITVKHLLTMNTGHSRAQTLELPFSVRSLLTVPGAFAPGTHFAYNSPASFALSAIVTAVSGESLTGYLRPRLFEPLGIGPRWWIPLDGIDQGFSGLHLSVDDLARLTICLADGGRFAGRQVIPASFIEEAVEPWSDTRDPADPDAETGDWGLGYGYQIWRSRLGYRLDGAYGQFGIVVPERGIAIAYQGASTEAHRTLDALLRLVDAFSDSTVEAEHDELGAQSLDSWPARALLAPTDPVEDAEAWALADADADRWLLTIPNAGTLQVDAGRWHRTTLGKGDASLVVAARGERRADGSVLVHLVVPTSAHRVILVRGDAGLQVRWHTTPLWRPIIGTLHVPEWVAHRTPTP
ncbi:serine hydrolase domain-containing protein [Microbacterium sp. NPDC056234]|uniref:serine hydrolase domain-containing protein n=1 Tax=Microbacterium sp. NPDC056234 TaxID=3345757 RepID=UPI0035E1D28F